MYSKIYIVHQSLKLHAEMANLPSVYLAKYRRLLNVYCSRCRLYSWKVQLLANIVDRAERRCEMHNARGPCQTKSLEDCPTPNVLAQ